MNAKKLKISAILILITIIISTAFPSSLGYIKNIDVNDDKGDKIFLKTSTFYPIFENPSIKKDFMIQENKSQYFIIQLDGPVIKPEIDLLISSGVKLLEYLPEYSYIARIDLINLPIIRNLPFVRWIGVYHPGYKISDELYIIDGQIDINVKIFEEIGNSLNFEESIKKYGGKIINFVNETSIFLVNVNASFIKNISFIPEVEWIELSGEKSLCMDILRDITGATILHNDNYNGSGIIGEIKDAGYDRNHPEFEGQILSEDGTVFHDEHGTSTFGIVFAKGLNARAKGMIPGAQGVFCDWGVGRYQSIQNLVNNWNGVFQSNSWSQGDNYNGGYNTYSQTNDQAVYDFDISMLYAAGNYGDMDIRISYDSNAKNVICVGGINHYNSYSMSDDQWIEASDGPSFDGRIKPDLCAAYDYIFTTDSLGSLGYSYGDYYEYFGGTSGATPIVAGAVGQVYQMYKSNHWGNNPSGLNPHASTVKSLLINHAFQYPLPQIGRYKQGWGFVDIAAIFKNSTDFIIDEDISLSTGESNSWTVSANSNVPLKITLVWTDIPGTSSSAKHLINDLSLKVTDPNNNIYWGNYNLINSLWSSSGGLEDHTNNVENVFIQNPINGEYTIEVNAYNIPEPITDPTQDFALVISGLTNSDTEILDQDQTDYTSAFPVYRSRMLGQSFKPSLDTLTSVELYVKKTGSPTGDLVVHIRDSISGSDLTSVSVSPVDIPLSSDWVSFDFSDISVNPGSTYYVVIGSSGGSILNCYRVGYSKDNPYIDGLFSYSGNSGSSWSHYLSYDLTFLSYGLSAPPVPVLSYTPASHDFGSMLEGLSGSTSFDIWNSGTGVLEYSFSESCSWVVVSPGDGDSGGEVDVVSVDVDTSFLSEGFHQCIVDIFSNGGSGSFTVEVTVVPENPVLSYTPASHDFGSMLEGLSGSTSFDIWNSGTGVLEYSFSESCSWVVVSPGDGDSGGEVDVVSVDVDTSFLSEGFHQCIVDIFSNGGSGSFTVEVTVVPENPVLSYTPASHDFGSMLEGLSGSTSFDIWNSGTGVLEYSFSESCSWVVVSPGDGDSGGEVDVVSVDVDTSFLSEGFHQCIVDIFSNGGSGSFTVEVTVVPENPVLSYTPASHDFGSMLEGLSGSTSFDIWNSGTGVLEYSFSESCSWVVVSPGDGDSGGEVDVVSVDVDTSFLSEGFHQCIVDIFSNGGSGSFTVEVTIVAGGTEILDQDQTDYTSAFPVYRSRMLGQSFKPSLDTLTSVELYVKKTGSPTGDLVVHIRDSISGSDLTSVSVSPVDIPLSSDWVSFDFSDISVNPGSTYYVVIGSSGGSILNCYRVGYSKDNPYIDGLFSYSGNSGSSWSHYLSYDLTFLSYGLSAPPVPVLSYTPASHDFGSMLEGLSGSTSFDIWNSGTGVLEYSFSESCSWVVVSPGDGDSGGEVDVVSVDVDTSFLSEGFHQCIVDIFSNGGSGSFTVEVTVVPENPVLSYTPASHDFGSMLEGLSGSTSFDIWNSGTGVLEYSFSESCSWVVVSPGDGDSGGEVDVVSVDVDTSFLSGGFHQCIVDIFSNGGSGSFTVEVTVVPENPVLSYTPASHDFGSMLEGLSGSTSFDIWNSGTGVLEYSFSESCSWVVVSPGDGDSGGEVDVVSVDVDTSFLSEGFHQCIVDIFSNGGSGSFTVEVTVVPENPVLSYTPASHDFGSMLEGLSGSTSFDIWNSGTGVLEYSFSESCSWVVVSPGDGDSGGEVDVVSVDVDTSFLSGGFHQCIVDIFSNGGSGSFTVEVTIVAGGTEILDQDQTDYTSAFPVYRSRMLGQSFKPSLDTLTSVELYVKKTGSPTGDLVVHIRDSISGSDLTSVSVSPVDIPLSSDWVSFDFSDISVNPGSTYYVVIGSSGGSILNCYRVGYSKDNPYIDGLFSYSGNSGSSWSHYLSYDLTFLSYGF